jgi:hypothetical protein
MKRRMKIINISGLFDLWSCVLISRASYIVELELAR